MEPITFNPAAADLQQQFDVAVVIPTVLRPKLIPAAQSVFAQKGVGRIQLLIGIDKPLGSPSIVERVRALCPDHCAVTILDLGYSTANRHGGPHEAFDGGALRTLLTLAANSRHVAYLDDDNRFAPDHLASLLKAVEGNDWAYSLRWYVNPYTEHSICIDRWESVGPGAGLYAKKRGGFVDPSSLLVDKLACLSMLHRWSSLSVRHYDPDRNFFDGLKDRPGGATGKATSLYALNVTDPRGEKLLASIRRLTGETPRREPPRTISRPLKPRFDGPGKVFGIGLSRTGTSSLTEALKMLGLSTVHFPTDEAEIEAHQAATDTTVADGFETLDRRYPGSLFIMTVRRRDEWLESCRKFWRSHRQKFTTDPLTIDLHRRLYDGIEFEATRFSHAYNRHMERVYAHFAGRPDDLLFLDICGGGDIWTPLSAFLGLPAPDHPFPHRNRFVGNSAGTAESGLISIDLTPGDARLKPTIRTD